MLLSYVSVPVYDNLGKEVVGYKRKALDQNTLADIAYNSICTDFDIKLNT
jgi:hypothetical protein